MLFGSAGLRNHHLVLETGWVVGRSTTLLCISQADRHAVIQEPLDTFVGPQKDDMAEHDNLKSVNRVQNWIHSITRVRYRTGRLLVTGRLLPILAGSSLHRGLAFFSFYPGTGSPSHHPSAKKEKQLLKNI